MPAITYKALKTQTFPLITAGTHPSISIDRGNDEPGMTLQYRERSYIVWRDYTVGGEVVKSPFTPFFLWTKETPFL